MQIYEDVRVQRERQEDVAARHSLTQQRVSEICSQVEKWRQWQASAPDYEATLANERRLRLLAARQREETVLLVALKQAAAERETLVTERRLTTAQGTQVTRTEKVLPTNPAWLKIVQSASQTLTRMNAKLGVDVQTSALAEEIDRLWAELLGGTNAAAPNEGANSCTSCSDKPQISAVKHLEEDALKRLPNNWLGSSKML
jgi:hypothetical protein